MRFRTSDKKTLVYFKKAGVESHISYITTALTTKVRVIFTTQYKEHTVLFVHGTPGSGDAFYSYLKNPALLEKANLVTYDRPGYGYSNFGEATISIEEQAKVIVEIVKRYHLKNVILVGHSYGGTIAAYAALLSEKIRGVILLAPAMDPDYEKYFWIGNLARWKLTRWIVPTSFVVSAAEKYSHESELRRWQDAWKAIDVPVVCLQGDKDMLVPYENLRFCEKRFNPDYFTGITLKKENHFIPWTKEELVVKEIMKFLD